MRNSKEKQLKLKGIRLRKDSEDMKNLASIMPTTFENIEKSSLGKYSTGVPVSFYDLDAMTQGLQRGSLVVVAGRPSMGKTSFAMNLAQNVAKRNKLPVCYFSLEQSREQMSYRFLSMELGIESGRLRTGRLQQDEWGLIGKEIEDLSEVPIFICDKGSIKVKEMFSKCKKIKDKQGLGELGLIVVDYIQMMDGPNKESRDKELSKIVLDLKEMAKALDVPVVLMSQLSRDIEKRENCRPMLCDLRETQGLEAHADVVIMLYRDEFYHPETEERGIAELIVTKHRNGPVGTVKLLFEPQYTRYRNLAA